MPFRRLKILASRLERPAMEPLPKGANFVRAKTLWEIGLHIAGNPATPYGGNRDMVITVGSGSGPELSALAANGLGLGHPCGRGRQGRRRRSRLRQSVGAAHAGVSRGRLVHKAAARAHCRLLPELRP